MKQVLAVFILLAAVSLVILLNGEHQSGSSRLSESLSGREVPPEGDRMVTSAAMARKAGPAPGAAEAPPLYDNERLRILDEILVSKNDNDPRMDHALRHLSEPLKRAMVARYVRLPAEQRNERGTLVFLVGRELGSAPDFEFMTSVLSESPCQSLADCKNRSPSSSDDDAVGTEANEVTLAYPQWVALRSLENFLSRSDHDAAAENGSDRWLADALASLRAGQKSRIPAVAQKAAELLRRFSKSYSTESARN